MGGGLITSRSDAGSTGSQQQCFSRTSLKMHFSRLQKGGGGWGEVGGGGGEG